MGLNEQLQRLIDKICMLYPAINKDEFNRKVMSLNIVENSDITDERPIVYDGINHILKLNSEKLKSGKYDSQYLVTVNLLLLTMNYNQDLNGLRYGYFAGVASNLVGNFVKETADDVEPGIDPYEDLRDCVSNLSSKIGAEKTDLICRSENLEVFNDLYVNSGLEDPVSFLNQLNYLLINSLNISEKQNNELVNLLKNGIPELTKEMSKKLS